MRIIAILILILVILSISLVACSSSMEEPAADDSGNVIDPEPTDPADDFIDDTDEVDIGEMI